MSKNGSLAINWFGSIVRQLIAMIVHQPYKHTQEFTTDKHHVHDNSGDKRFVNMQSIFFY